MAVGYDKRATEPTLAARPGLLLGAGHLAALWALAVVQPLFDLLGNSGDFFIARGDTGGDVLIFAAAVTIVPPLAMLLIEALAAMVGERLRWGVHLALVGILASTLALQVLKQVASRPAGLLIGLALLAGAGAAAAYARTMFAQSLCSVLVPAPLVLLALFLLSGDGADLVLPNSDPGPEQVSVSGRTPVVMLLFDELPTLTLLDQRGNIDARRFPGFAALARQATWYPNNTTSADETLKAVPDILTGTRSDPSEVKLPDASQYPHNIFTLLGGSYRMNVRETATSLCPDKICGARERPSQSERVRDLFSDLTPVEGRLLLPESLGDKLPEVGTASAGFGSAAAIGQFVLGGFAQPTIPDFRRFLAGIRPGRDFSLIHAWLPHQPFGYLPDGQTYYENSISTASKNDRALGGPAGAATMQQRHFAQVGYVDRLVAMTIRRMKAEGIWRKAMMVVTADHGISFIPGSGVRYIEHSNAADIANPPLLIKYPGQRAGRVSDVHTRSIDIVPTIAQTLGVKIPYPHLGRPVAADSHAGSAVVYRFNEGEIGTYPVRLIERQRAAHLRRQVRVLGTGGLYALGPRPNLIGKRVPPGPPLRKGRRAVAIENGAEPAVDPSADSIPAFVAGILYNVSPGTRIAVSVNGRVAATTRAFHYDDGGTHFGAIVSPAVFHDGLNDIRAYLIGPHSRLIPIAIGQ